MMLMMLVSLSAFCQYPTIKKVGRDSVVIMTLEQANDINTKFAELQQKIVTLNKTIEIHQIENKKVIDSLKITNSSLKYQTRESNYYKEEFDNLKKDYRASTRDYQSNTTLLLAGAGAFLIGVLLLHK